MHSYEEQTWTASVKPWSDYLLNVAGQQVLNIQVRMQHAQYVTLITQNMET